MKTLILASRQLHRQGLSAFAAAMLTGLLLCLLVGLANDFAHPAIKTLGLLTVIAALFFQKYWVWKMELQDG